MLDINEVLPTKKAGFEVHDMGTEMVVHDTVRKKVHILNKAAFMIWESCDGKTTIGHLLSQMSSIFKDIPEDAVKTDIETALQNLRQIHLV